MGIPDTHEESTRSNGKPSKKLLRALHLSNPSLALWEDSPEQWLCLQAALTHSRKFCAVLIRTIAVSASCVYALQEVLSGWPIKRVFGNSVRLFPIRARLFIRQPHTRHSNRPMSDHFALVPRAFADRFFNAISTFYACDGVSWPPPAWWWTPACAKSGFEESVLFRYLHFVDIPYRHYSRFEYNQVRGGAGGLCKTGAGEYRTICNVMDISSTLSSASNDT